MRRRLFPPTDLDRKVYATVDRAQVAGIQALKAGATGEEVDRAARQVIEEAGGRVIAVGALVDRSGGKIEFPVESQSLLGLNIPSYTPEDCPQCKEGGTAVKPGSRFVRPKP